MKTPTRWCPGTTERTCPDKETLDTPQRRRCHYCAQRQDQLDVARSNRERGLKWTAAGNEEAVAQARMVDAQTGGIRGAMKVFDVMLRVA